MLGQQRPILKIFVEPPKKRYLISEEVAKLIQFTPGHFATHEKHLPEDETNRMKNRSGGGEREREREESPVFLNSYIHPYLKFSPLTSQLCESI